MIETEIAARELETQADRHACPVCSTGTCWGKAKRMRLAAKLRTLDALPTPAFLVRMMIANDGYSSERPVSSEHAAWCIDRVMARVTEAAQPTPP